MKKLDGMRWDEFEKWVEERYPFGKIRFNGGGGIYIETGEEVYQGTHSHPVHINTDLFEGEDKEGSFVKLRQKVTK